MSTEKDPLDPDVGFAEDLKDDGTAEKPRLSRRDETAQELEVRRGREAAEAEARQKIIDQDLAAELAVELIDQISARVPPTDWSFIGRMLARHQGREVRFGEEEYAAFKSYQRWYNALFDELLLAERTLWDLHDANAAGRHHEIYLRLRQHIDAVIRQYRDWQREDRIQYIFRPFDSLSVVDKVSRWLANTA